MPACGPGTLPHTLSLTSLAQVFISLFPASPLSLYVPPSASTFFVFPPVACIKELFSGLSVGLALMLVVYDAAVSVLLGGEGAR